jgi:hypothetical protein
MTRREEASRTTARHHQPFTGALLGAVGHHSRSGPDGLKVRSTSSGAGVAVGRGASTHAAGGDASPAGHGHAAAGRPGAADVDVHAHPELGLHARRAIVPRLRA